MEQRLKLEAEVRVQRESLRLLQSDIRELEKAWSQKEMLRKRGAAFANKELAKPNSQESIVRCAAIRACRWSNNNSPSSVQVNGAMALEREVSQLQASCNKMVDEVTQITGGKGKEKVGKLYVT